jgi:hypothetical protein
VLFRSNFLNASALCGFLEAMPVAIATPSPSLHAPVEGLARGMLRRLREALALGV